MPLQHRPPAIDAAGPDAGRDILLERLVEGAALAPVEGEHAAILLHTAERLRNHALRDAASRGLLRDRRHKGVELAAAAGGISGSGEDEGNEKDRKSTRLNSSHQINSYAVFCLK